MARLPTPGADAGQWGQILNDYLSAAHNPDGTLKDNVVDAGSIADGSVVEANLAPSVVSKLNAVGGQTGATGPTGASGPAGIAGATGVAGTVGATGATGPQGAAGNDGTQGSTGATGPQGSAGTDGAPGATGPVGATGPAGANGATGATGPQGPAGTSSGTQKVIAGLTYFAVSSRSFPALVRPPEQSRGRFVIRNVGTNNVNVVVANRVTANYNSPGWTGAISVAAGKELVADGSASDLFIGPDADGTLIKVKVYAEVNY